MTRSTVYRTFNLRLEQLEKLERLAKAARTNVNAVMKALIDAAPEPEAVKKASSRASRAR